MAKEILKAKRRHYAFIKATRATERDLPLQRHQRSAEEAMDAGKIKNVCETFTDGWKPDNAQKEWTVPDQAEQ